MNNLDTLAFAITASVVASGAATTDVRNEKEEKVYNLISEALFQDTTEEIPENAMTAYGLYGEVMFGFDPVRLEQVRERVKPLLAELSQKLMLSNPDADFDSACAAFNEDMELPWSWQLRYATALIALGSALGYLIVIPAEVSDTGEPLVVINDALIV